jgi:hypothetical protein
MRVTVRTSDGRIFDADCTPTATCHELLVALFAPHPVPRNSQIMARTRLIDPGERVANVMQNDLFLVGPKPDQVAARAQQQQQQAPPPHHHGHGHHGHHHQHQHQAHDPSLEHAKQAVNHLQDFVASPVGPGAQPQFQYQDNRTACEQQQQQRRQPQQQQQQQQQHFQPQSPPPPPPPPPQFQQQQPAFANGAQQQQQTPPPQAKKPTTPAEILADVRLRYEELNTKSHSSDCSHKERLWINEMSMKEMFRLDGLEGLPAEQKADRKDLVTLLLAMQDYNTEQNKAK